MAALIKKGKNFLDGRDNYDLNVVRSNIGLSFNF